MPKTSRVPEPIEDGDQESERILGLGFRVVKGDKALNPQPTPEEILSKKELLELLDKMLSDNEAIVVKRHFINEDELKEIARDLDIPIAKIRMASICAMRKLRRPVCADKLRKFLR